MLPSAATGTREEWLDFKILDKEILDDALSSKNSLFLLLSKSIELDCDLALFTILFMFCGGSGAGSLEFSVTYSLKSVVRLISFADMFC
jgi:hypothetical protein